MMVGGSETLILKGVIMRRPNRAVCVLVVGLAVLVGCAKKKKTEPEASSGNTNPVAAAGTGTPPAGDGQVAPPPPSRASTVFTAEGEAATKAAPPVKGPDPVAGGAKTGSTGAPGKVDLVQCRFDKVEAALAAAKGKVVLVDCWARWCPPCIESFPQLVAKHEKYNAKGLVCISVSLDSGRKQFTPDQVLAFLKEKNATFQNFYLTDQRADDAAMDARFGEISGIPHAVMFNKKGEKIWHGHPMDRGLVAKIEAELAK